MTYRFTPRAEQDLVEIADHVAEDDPVAAITLIDTIEKSCQALADHPRLGPARDDIARGLRFLPVKSYLILYRVSDPHVDIIRIVHGARRLNGLLS